MPVVAADVSLPNPPQPWAETSVFDTPHRLVTVAVKPDATIMSKGKPEAAPLPPTKPRTLASAGTTAVRAAPTTGNITPAASKAAETTPAKPSDASANGAGASSFSIQLASSLSESEAHATLSRLKKQFPDALGGGSVRRAEGNGNGVFYRVQAGPLSRNAAENACSRLKASGENCIVVRS
jgi:cell division septation protein DedD